MDKDFEVNSEMQESLKRIAKEKKITISDALHEALGDYVSKQNHGLGYDGVMDTAESKLKQYSNFTTSIDPSKLVLIVKSPLKYTHRPEIKYEVRINRASDQSLGWINVILRSHDINTIKAFSEFLNIWISLEDKYAENTKLKQNKYKTDTDYFGIRINKPVASKQYSDSLLGDAISNYISVFDELLKFYYSRRSSLSAPQLGSGIQAVEKHYLIRFNKGDIII